MAQFWGQGWALVSGAGSGAWADIAWSPQGLETETCGSGSLRTLGPARISVLPPGPEPAWVWAPPGRVAVALREAQPVPWSSHRAGHVSVWRRREVRVPAQVQTTVGVCGEGCPLGGGVSPGRGALPLGFRPTCYLVRPGWPVLGAFWSCSAGTEDRAGRWPPE